MLRLRKSLHAVQQRECDPAYSDVDAFWAMATSEAAMRVFPVAKFLSVANMCMLLLSICYRSPASYQFSYSFFCLLCAALWISKSAVCRHLKKRPVFIGCAIQLGVHLCVGVASALIFSSMPDELRRHRMYLGTAVPVFLLSIVGGYLPPLIVASCACPIFFLSWLTFHYMVGFINSLCVVYAVILCGGSVIVAHLLDDSNHKIFRMTRELEMERSLLEASQATFQAMLSTIFDASAFCDANGELSQLTPQLRELLGDGENLHSTCLWDYASGQSEQDRLCGFLERATETAIHQAAKIQVLLKSDKTCTMSKAVGGTEGHVRQTLEVSIYAVRLALASSQLPSHGRMFLGFQVQSTEEPDQIGEFTQNSAEGEHDRVIIDMASGSIPGWWKHTQEDTPNGDAEDTSECSSLASSWGLSPSDFIELQEFSSITFVVDALRKDLPIERVTFDFSDDLDTEGKTTDTVGMAHFMPTRLWDSFVIEVQERLNAEVNEQSKSSFNPVFLQLPSRLTGAHEVLLRADSVTLKLGRDGPKQLQDPMVEDCGSSEDSETEGDGFFITLRLENIWQVNLPSVNPKRLGVRRNESQQMPIIQESSLQ